MDVPPPIIITPREDDITDIKEYKMVNNNEDLVLKIGKINSSKKIIFKIEILDNLINYCYKSDFSLEQFKSINKLFKIFDSIDEIYNEINEIFNNKKFLIQKELNVINLHLYLSSISSKTEDICLIIKKEKINEKIINDLIIKELKEVKILLKEEKKKNENLKNIVDDLKNKVEELIKWKESQTPKKKLENNNYNIDSKIIQRNEEIELLVNRLRSNRFIKNEIKLNLIYRASRDGDSPQNYHNKCDGKKNTIFIIQTDKGCKFGGYTETMIKSGDGSVDDKDKNSFIFSFNKMKIYENMKKEKGVICHSKNWGPIFRCTISVNNKKFFLDNEHMVGSKKNSYFGVMNEDYEINNGERYFTIKELEVFQVIIE